MKGGIVLVREIGSDAMLFDHHPDAETWNVYAEGREELGHDVGFAVWSPLGKVCTRPARDVHGQRCEEPDPWFTFPMGWSFRCDHDRAGRLIPQCIMPMAVNSRRSLIRALLARLDDNDRAVAAWDAEHPRLHGLPFGRSVR